MVNPAEPRKDDGSVLLTMFGLAVISIAALFGIVEPAGEEYRRTRAKEDALRRQIESAERERKGLENLEKGLSDDPGVIERELRSAGRGKPGEVRIVPTPESRGEHR